MAETAIFVGINLPWAPKILAQTYPGCWVGFFFPLWYVGFFWVRSAFGHLLQWLEWVKTIAWVHSEHLSDAFGFRFCRVAPSAYRPRLRLRTRNGGRVPSGWLGHVDPSQSAQTSFPVLFSNAKAETKATSVVVEAVGWLLRRGCLFVIMCQARSRSIDNSVMDPNLCKQSFS